VAATKATKAAVMSAVLDLSWMQEEPPAAEILTLADMLTRFVHVTRGPMVVDRGLGRHLWRPQEFQAKYAHCSRGKHLVTTEWLRSADRIVVDDVTFDPAGDEFITTQGVTYYNLWREPYHNARLVLSGTEQPFLNHIAYLIPAPNEARDFLDYLAHCVQCPGIRPHFHFLLVTPATGTGRSWIGALMQRLFGPKYAKTADLHRLLGDAFNDILSGAIVVTCSEVKAPAKERFSQKDRLKSLLTDEVIEINPKYQPRRVEKLCARFLLFSNREDALPIDETDRRIYAVGCADQPRHQDYYRDLYSRLEDPRFVASVWSYLKGRDISAFNPGMRAPMTTMKSQLIEAGRTDEQQDTVEFVHACPHDVVYSSDLLRIVLGLDNGDPDRRQKVQAVVAVLRDIGVQALPRKVKPGIGDPQRVYVVRAQSEWRAATPAKVRDAAEMCRAALAQEHWDRTNIIDRWRSGIYR